MAASGSVIDLRNSRARAAAQQLQAAVRCVAACIQQAEGPDLAELLIQIREVGVDPLEAAFATGVRRFDRSGEYAADGALSVVAWLKWKCKLSGGAAAERVEIGSSSSSACPRPKKRLPGAIWDTSTSPSSPGPPRTSERHPSAEKKPIC